MSATTYVIHPGVSWEPESSSVGDFVIIGEPARGMLPGAEPTTIAAGAVIRSHTVIYAGNVIGRDLQTGHGVLIRESNRIGNKVSIGSHSVVEHHVDIGDGVRIHSNAFVPEFTVLEGACWIGPGTVLTNARYPQSRDVRANLRGPRVGAGAIIGANVTLLPGIHVGAGALVGAGAVVVEDVPSDTVVVGNPARIVRKVSDLDAYDRRREPTD